ncbi:MAG: S41 family peptidase [Verrucomicrobiota bacterium]
MRKLFLPLILCLISTVSLRGGHLVDELDQAALQKAFRQLQKDYIRPEALTYEEINRAALLGLMERLKLGAQLVTLQESEGEETEIEKSKSPPTSSELTTECGYLRMSALSQESLAALDETLAKFEASGHRTLILDLRVPQQPLDDLSLAARLLDRFISPNVILFKREAPGKDRPDLFVTEVTDVRWNHAVLCLVDEETPMAGELIAAVLKRERRIPLLGGKTAGRTVQYEDYPLSPDTALRVANSEILLADDTSLFEAGVSPDFEIPFAREDKHKVFAASEHAPLLNFLFDEARPRMNEAALVQETDPELDYYLTRSQGKKTKFDHKPLQDVVLQRAVDLVTTVAMARSEADLAED